MNTVQLVKHFWICILVVIGLWVPASYAVSNADKALLDELNYLKAEKVEISLSGATKTEIPLAKVPGAVTVFTMAQIRQSNAKTIPDLLRLSAGVQVRQNPMTQVITMRGFGSTPFTSRVLLLIDGVPYNDWNKGGFIQQPGLDFFPLENVKQLEVIKGPGSALYGENAQWGMINIKTISGEDIDGVRATYYAGSRNTQVANLQLGKKFSEDLSVLATGKFTRSQFPTSFWYNDVNDPNIKATDLYIKARYKKLTASYYRYDDRVDGYTESIEEANLPPDAKFKSADKIKQSAEIYAVNYKDKFSDGKYSFSGDLSYAKRDGSHCGTCHAKLQEPTFDGRSEDHGFQAIGDFRLGIHAIKNHDILFGAEVRRVDAGVHSNELGTQVAGHGHTEDMGSYANAFTKPAVYVQDMISLFDNKLSVTLGGRYDLQTYPSLFKSAFSPRAALVYSATDRLTFRGGWSKAFRFPSFSELFQNSWFFNIQSNMLNTAFPLVSFKPNPSLQPEQIESGEIGAEYKFNPFFTSKLNLYHSTIKNSIVLVYDVPDPPQSGTLISENHPNTAIVMGGELELLFEYSPQIHGFANWSFKRMSQEGNGVDSVGNPIEFTYAPNHQFNIGGYFGPFSGVSAALEYSWQSSYIGPLAYYKIRHEAPHALEDYGYFNLRLNYQPPVRLFNKQSPITLSGYFKNILDNRPEESIFGAPMIAPGRELFFGAEMQF